MKVEKIILPNQDTLPKNERGYWVCYYTGGAEEFNLATTYYEDFGVANCHSTLQTIMIPVLDKDKMNTSSSRVREYIRHGKWNHVLHYCPAPIYQYIKDHQENSK